MADEQNLSPLRLQSVRIRDFRRFSDLTIQGISNSPKLIMLAGPNGSGKSSFFDALSTWHRAMCRGDHGFDSGYHRKISSEKVEQWQGDDVVVEFHAPMPIDPREKKKLFYFRSAYRNDPDFQTTRLNQVGDMTDEVRFRRMIENDAAVSKNYQRMASQGMEAIYDTEDPALTIGEFREKTIGDVKSAVLRVFPDLKLNSLGNPLQTGTFLFSKGVSKGFLFKNLSGGEKAVFDLVLDMVVASRTYDRTIFCIDEPESHMNSRLQAELLSVLYDLVPADSQLILATHSIGMMRKAVDIERQTPGSVAFLDFGEKDFDATVTMEPEKPSRQFWQRAYSVALDDLASLIAPSRIVVCEGGPAGISKGRNAEHDAKCYDRIFSEEFPETRFLSGGNALDVESDRLGLIAAMKSLTDGMEVIRLIDRDDQSDEEVAERIRDGVRIVCRRNIEGILFDDEILKILAERSGFGHKSSKILAEKSRLLTESNGAIGDIKPIAGLLYVFCKKELELSGCGNTVQAFMRDTLSPMVRPGTAIYDELREAIFGE